MVARKFNDFFAVQGLIVTAVCGIGDGGDGDEGVSALHVRPCSKMTKIHRNFWHLAKCG